MAGPPQVFPIHSKRGSSMEAVEIIAQDTPGRISDSTHAYLFCRWKRIENLAADVLVSILHLSISLIHFLYKIYEN